MRGVPSMYNPLKFLLKWLRLHGKKTMAVITAVCFLSFEIMWASEYSSLLEEDEKDKEEQSVLHSWTSVSESAKGGDKKEYTDEEKQQVYRFEKGGQLAEIEDLKTGLT